MNTRLSNIYQQMKNRCYNPNNPSYKNYGGRGITICAEWNSREKIKGTRGNNTKGFTAFKKWALNNGYTSGLPIDRIDNSKGYSPDNCRWATAIMQGRNRRNNKLITYKNETHCISEWAEIFNIPRKCLEYRVRTWNDLDRVFNRPVTKNNRI